MNRQAEHLRAQARACAHLGSAMYDELLTRLADDLDAGGTTATVLRGHEADPGPSGLALRLVGGVHRLVLAGSVPELSAYYPTVGGTWSSRGSEAVLAFLAARGEEVRPLLDQAPQTNEVGRAAALVGGLLRLAARWPLPVRLWEIGASGGLNLQADRFRITGPAGAWGDPAGPVVLEEAWTGRPLPVDAHLRVVERGGCDVSPVDVTTEAGRLTLTSYVWPDMTARHERLAGAIALAPRPPGGGRADRRRVVRRTARDGAGAADGAVAQRHVAVRPPAAAGPGARAARGGRPDGDRRTRPSSTCTPSPPAVRRATSTASGCGPGRGPGRASPRCSAGWRHTARPSRGSDPVLRE